MLTTQYELKKELADTKQALNRANEQLYNKTWQLAYAYKMLDRIMKRSEPDEYSLKLLLNDLHNYTK